MVCIPIGSWWWNGGIGGTPCAKAWNIGLFCRGGGKDILACHFERKTTTGQLAFVCKEWYVTSDSLLKQALKVNTSGAGITDPLGDEGRDKEYSRLLRKPVTVGRRRWCSGLLETTYRPSGDSSCRDANHLEREIHSGTDTKLGCLRWELCACAMAPVAEDESPYLYSVGLQGGSRRAARRGGKQAARAPLVSSPTLDELDFLFGALTTAAGMRTVHWLGTTASLLWKQDPKATGKKSFSCSGRREFSFVFPTTSILLNAPTPGPSEHRQPVNQTECVVSSFGGHFRDSSPFLLFNSSLAEIYFTGQTIKCSAHCCQQVAPFPGMFTRWSVELPADSELCYTFYKKLAHWTAANLMSA